MAAKKRKTAAAAGSGAKKAPRKTKPKVEPASVGLSAAETGSGEPPARSRALAEKVESEGGAVLAHYREPLGGHWVLLASLPMFRSSARP